MHVYIVVLYRYYEQRNFEYIYLCIRGIYIDHIYIGYMPEHVSSPELDVSHFRKDLAILELRFTAVD